MTKKLKAVIAAACLCIMLTPGMIMAAEDDSATPPDNGQMIDEANPSSADNPQSGDTGNGSENAMPENGQGNDETAPSDSEPMDNTPADAPPAE
jgi:hypothetical protein